MDLPDVVFVGPLAALAGVAVGPYLTNRAEERRWRRQQRAEAASGLLKALADLDRPRFRIGVEVSVGELANLISDGHLASQVFAVYFTGDIVTTAANAVDAAIDREVARSEGNLLPDQADESTVTRLYLVDALTRELGSAR